MVSPRLYIFTFMLYPQKHFQSASRKSLSPILWVRANLDIILKSKRAFFEALLELEYFEARAGILYSPAEEVRQDLQ